MHERVWLLCTTHVTLHLPQVPGKDINHTVDMSAGHKLLHIVVFFLVLTTPLTVLVVLLFSMRHVLQQYGCVSV